MLKKQVMKNSCGERTLAKAQMPTQLLKHSQGWTRMRDEVERNLPITLIDKIDAIQSKLLKLLLVYEDLIMRNKGKL